MKAQRKPISNPNGTQRLGQHEKMPTFEAASPNLGQSRNGTSRSDVPEDMRERAMRSQDSRWPSHVARLFNGCSTHVTSCGFCSKTEGHEPWCQVSPEWIALDAVWDAAECISEATTIESLYDLAKHGPDTECLTLEMVRELVTSWVEIGEWEESDGGYRRLA